MIKKILFIFSLFFFILFTNYAYAISPSNTLTYNPFTLRSQWRVDRGGDGLYHAFTDIMPALEPQPLFPGYTKMYAGPFKVYFDNQSSVVLDRTKSTEAAFDFWNYGVWATGKSTYIFKRPLNWVNTEAETEGVPGIRIHVYDDLCAGLEDWLIDNGKPPLACSASTTAISLPQQGLTQCDIFIRRLWGTESNLSANRFFVLAHELGHCMGLAHGGGYTSIMSSGNWLTTSIIKLLP